MLVSLGDPINHFKSSVDSEGWTSEQIDEPLDELPIDLRPQLPLGLFLEFATKMSGLFELLSLRFSA